MNYLIYIGLQAVTQISDIEKVFHGNITKL